MSCRTTHSKAATGKELPVDTVYAGNGWMGSTKAGLAPTFWAPQCHTYSPVQLS